MQIFATEQIRAWDEYTIEHEPVTSIDLMERAATACYDWLMDHGYKEKNFAIFCAKGNNGGDGLAIARMLAESGHAVTVHILEFGHKGTVDFQVNLARLHETSASIRFISGEENIAVPDHSDIIIDALLGSGLNRPLEGLTKSMVDCINDWENEVIAIDIPSGLFADRSSKGQTVIHANHSLSFQTYKTAFLVPENAGFTGAVHILDIGLHPGFPRQQKGMYEMIDRSIIRAIIQPREQFAHKGNFGYAGLVAGSKGMMGAAVLSAKACLRAGTGKLTCHIPAMGYTTLQTSLPEAMCKTDESEDHISSLPHPLPYDVLGIGPGLGKYDSHKALLENLFDQYKKPLVIDADALNMLAEHKALLSKLPAGSIITPHVKEFERLFGPVGNDFDRIALAREKAAELNIVIVLKGHYSFIAAPGGQCYFNDTGNPGMATGGTGDVLTGILTGVLAQEHEPVQAAIAGVYLHGLAGDLAAAAGAQESLIASDIIDYLPAAFKAIRQ